MRVALPAVSTSIALTAASLFTASCSSPSSHATADADTDGCPAYESDADLTTPTVSFKKNVLPIFETKCGQGTTCHGGDPAVAIELRGVFLGCVPDASASCEAAADPGPQVYGGLVGPDANVPAEESCMPFVTARDPAKSYLMHKVDDDLCAVPCCIDTNSAATSVGEMGCGTIMPYLSAILPAETRDTIRRWIEQGAGNN